MHPQGHASKGDRTREFVVIADRPVHNSRGILSSLPLQFGRDLRGSVVWSLRVLAPQASLIAAVFPPSRAFRPLRCR